MEDADGIKLGKYTGDACRFECSGKLIVKFVRRLISVMFILPWIAVLFKPPKPDQSGMPIFRSAEAGAGLQ
jgi:hypothetical protein